MTLRFSVFKPIFKNFITHNLITANHLLILLLTALRTLPLGDNVRRCLEAPEGGRSNTLPASDAGDASCGAWVTKGIRVSLVRRENTPRFSAHWKYRVPATEPSFLPVD